VLERRFFEVSEAAAERWQVPALAVGVLAGGESETFAVGCAPETRFRVASITKPFVAHLVLSLLDADEPTGVWPADVRVRHLLSHTAGFDCELPHSDMTGFGDGDDALARCVAELPSVRRLVGLDQLWSYCNPGYWLAGSLAAARAGSTFEDAIATHVCAAAALDATDFGEPDISGTGRDVRGYPRARRPSGGLVSTVDDLLRFASWHLEQPLGAQMRVVTAKPVRGVYGFGLFGERVAGVDVWGHSGSFGGFQSSLLIVPDREAAFVGLTNSEIGSKALREVEDEFFALVIGARRAVPTVVELSPELYAARVGTYANAGGSWRVAYDGDDGLVVTTNGETFRARAIDDSSFYVPEGRHIYERFDFPRDGFGRFGSTLAERVA
jgi:CubicO group peptidase (beta-lactamase class C family)